MKNNKETILTDLLILFIFMIVSSCDNKKDTIPFNVIPVESTVGSYNILNLSDFASSVFYIPLETNESVLISSVIRKIIYENEKILILDITSQNKHNCYLFDNNGKFLRKIGRWGQGPNDYLQINNVSIFENLIYLMDRQKILIYDMNGNLIENISLQSSELPEEYRMSALRSIIPLKKNAFVVNVVTSDGSSYPTAFLFETHQSTVKTIKEYSSTVKLDKLRESFSTTELGSMYRFKDDVRIFKIINDTIFTIGQNTEMKDAFIFDLGKYRTTQAYIEAREGFNGNLRDYIDYGKKFIVPYIILESLNHLFFHFGFGNHAPEPFEYNNYVYGVFDKRTGDLTLMRQPIKGKLGFKNDIDNGPVFFPHYISSKNELVTYISAEDFLDYYDKIENPTPKMTEVAKNINLDDNEIVIIAKLK